MGNRAVIAFGHYGPKATGVYVHWNGGRESIEGFLAAARELGIGPKEGQSPDDRARDVAATPKLLSAMIQAFFGPHSSVELATCDRLDCDNYDNGVYIVDENLKIVGRRFNCYPDENDPQKTEGVKKATIEAAKRDIRFTHLAGIELDPSPLPENH